MRRKGSPVAQLQHYVWKPPTQPTKLVGLHSHWGNVDKGSQSGNAFEGCSSSPPCQGSCRCSLWWSPWGWSCCAPPCRSPQCGTQEIWPRLSACMNDPRLRGRDREHSQATSLSHHSPFLQGCYRQGQETLADHLKTVDKKAAMDLCEILPVAKYLDWQHSW